MSCDQYTTIKQEPFEGENFCELVEKYDLAEKSLNLWIARSYRLLSTELQTSVGKAFADIHKTAKFASFLAQKFPTIYGVSSTKVQNPLRLQ